MRGTKLKLIRKVSLRILLLGWICFYLLTHSTCQAQEFEPLVQDSFQLTTGQVLDMQLIESTGDSIYWTSSIGDTVFLCGNEWPYFREVEWDEKDLTGDDVPELLAWLVLAGSHRFGGKHGGFGEEYTYLFAIDIHKGVKILNWLVKYDYGGASSPSNEQLKDYCRLTLALEMSEGQILVEEILYQEAGNPDCRASLESLVPEAGIYQWSGSDWITD